jgi:serralysin
MSINSGDTSELLLVPNLLPDLDGEMLPKYQLPPVTAAVSVSLSIATPLPVEEDARSLPLVAPFSSPNAINMAPDEADQGWFRSIEQADQLPIALAAASNTPQPVTSSTLNLGNTFKLHSNITAKHRIYLDFDGHTTTNTGWNKFLGLPSFTSPAYDSRKDGASFNSIELQQIQNIWQRIVEDFAPFEIDVTTEAPDLEDLKKTSADDPSWGVRVVFTADDRISPKSGGIGYQDSFDDAIDTPVFVFNANELGAAEAASHEVGHSLGLSHDTKTGSNAYYRGHGTGATSWAPIMGSGYYSKVTQWSKGEYSLANNQEDDLAIITGSHGFGYRADDYGDSFDQATVLRSTANSAIGAFGIIERNTDVDIFSFTTAAGQVSLNINPSSRAYVSKAGGGYTTQYLPSVGANLDIGASLYNSNGVLLKSSSPGDALGASFDLNLAAGQYFLEIDGVGTGSPLAASPTGYTDYGSLGQYAIAGKIVTPPTPQLGSSANDTLTGTAKNDYLIGLAGSDRLDGLQGADMLDGGDGDDIYYIDNAGDTIINESITGGMDTVISQVTYTLGTYQENLTLSGTAAIKGTGNIANNIITGNGANNELRGGGGTDQLFGGAGQDTLFANVNSTYLAGGAGADIFVLSNGGRLPAAGQQHTIADFLIGSDRLKIIGVPGVKDFSNLSIGQVGVDTNISVANGAVVATLLNVQASDLTKTSFVFG